MGDGHMKPGKETDATGNDIGSFTGMKHKDKWRITFETIMISRISMIIVAFEHRVLMMKRFNFISSSLIYITNRIS